MACLSLSARSSFLKAWIWSAVSVGVVGRVPSANSSPIVSPGCESDTGLALGEAERVQLFDLGPVVAVYVVHIGALHHGRGMDVLLLFVREAPVALCGSCLSGTSEGAFS